MILDRTRSPRILCGMKNGVIVALVSVFAVSGLALVFCRKEDAADSPARDARKKAAFAARVAAGTASDGKSAGPKTKARPKGPEPVALTPEEEAAEVARLVRIAEARSAFEAAVGANDPFAIASRDFLAANSQRAGVVTTANGLQYETMTPGTGAMPAATDTVKVHYHGTLPDGMVFDSSVARGEPISFPLNAVIAGWTEGVQLMPVGSKMKLFIPPWLAYGSQGAGEKIGPHAALVFEVELLEIEQKQE